MSYPTYPECEESGVAWIGQKPKDWQVMKLHHMVRMKSGSAITSVEMDDDGEYPVFGGNGVRGRYPEYTHEGSYVLIGRQGAECGNINYAHGKFWASEHAVVAKPDRELEYRWLGETLRAMNLNQYSQAAAQPGLSVEVIGRLKLPFPPIPEQLQIAAFLDWKTGQIDALIARKQELLEKLKEKRLAVITQAVTRGLNPAAPLRDSGIPWLGQVPEHWQVMKLHHMVRMRSGSAITSIEMDEDGEYPVFGGNGVRGRFSEFTHQGDYVLIGRQGAECGNINYAHGKFWASEHAVVATPDRELDYRWLGETLRAMNLNQYSQAAAQPGLSVEVIGRLKMPFPPVEEQAAIAHYLDAEDTKFHRMVEKVEEAIARLTEYRTALITAATTGKIDVRNVIVP
jgi:type I restriction enzyme S subunit